MYGELADQQLAAMVVAVGSKTGQGQAVVDKFAVQGGKYGAHAASITKGRYNIKKKCWLLVVTLYKPIRLSALGARLNSVTRYMVTRYMVTRYMVTRYKGPRFLVDTIVIAPPFEWQIDNLARGGDGVEGPEGFQNNSALLSHIPWFAERVTKRPFQINAAWRLYLFSVLTYDRDSHGGDASFFDLSLYQSHGLIADASSRG
jgi:hypothetical protein